MDRRKRRRLLSALQSGILEDIRSISNTAIASFTGDGRDLVRLVVGIEPVQAGSGDPSPDNVRPISGWAECKVTRTGKNLLDPSARTTSAQNIRYYQNDNLLLKAGTYTLSISSQVSGLYVNSGASTLFEKYNSTFLAFTLTEDTPVHFDFYKSGIDTSSLCQLEVGSTASSYEPYQGQTYTIDLDGTRYGGTLDVTTGKLMVDRAMVDMGTLNWSSWEQGGSLIFNSHISAKMPVRDVPCISSQYAYNPAIVSSWSDLLNGQMTGQAGGDVVYVRDTRYSSNADFKTGVSGVQLVYPLATPIEVDLDPVTIETLLGTNNIFADCGDTTVDYYADTTLFVNKKIAAAVAALS